ncbi:MAG: TraB/VirB10 family protein [Mariprofundales bacterium]
MSDIHLQNARRSKQQKIYLYGGLAVIFIFIFIGLSVFSPESKEPSKTEDDSVDYHLTSPGAIVDEPDIWQSQLQTGITNMQRDQQTQTQEMIALRREIAALKAKQQKADDAQKQQAAIGGMIPDAPNAVTLPELPPAPVNAIPYVQRMGPQADQQLAQQQRNRGVPGQASNNAVIVPAGQGGNGQPIDPIYIIEIPVPNTTPEDTEDKSKLDSDAPYLPAGAFTKAQLLSGLDAPAGGSAQDDPHPVLMRLTDLSVLPNRANADIRECFVLGSGYGDMSSERAYIRLVSLSCTDTNGIAWDMSLKGFVAGEDGKAGMRGRLVSKQGQILAQALLAGVASGIADGFGQSTQTLSFSPLGATSLPDPNKLGATSLSGGVEKAMSKLADFYIEQAQAIYPIIEIDAGRTVDLILTAGVSLKVARNDVEIPWTKPIIGKPQITSFRARR